MSGGIKKKNKYVTRCEKRTNSGHCIITEINPFAHFLENELEIVVLSMIFLKLLNLFKYILRKLKRFDFFCKIMPFEVFI